MKILNSTNVDGQLTILTGSATTPSLSVVNDTNTGMFFPAADTIALTEGGVEVLRINSSANVGIGTSTPTFKLHVLGTGAGDATFTGGILIENNNATAGEPALAFRNSAVTTSNYWFTGLNQVDAYQIGRGTSFTDANTFFKIDSSGNIGIATTLPTTKLEVVGTISSSNLRTGVITASSITSTNIFATTLTASTVNITTLTVTNLTVSNLTASSRIFVGVGSADTPSFAAINDTNTGIFFPTADTIALTEGGVEVLRINSSGNVGIGTQTPSYKLQVVGDFAATTKSFVIPHPLDASRRLRYSSLEGPENGVYIRGRATSSVILLPDYFAALVNEDSITVHLNPLGNTRQPQIKSVSAAEIILKARWFSAIDCYYIVFAERKDVPRLEVEI